MLNGADAAGADIELAGIGFVVGDDVLQRADRQRRMHGEQIGREHHHADRHQILLHVERQPFHQAGLGGERADIGDEQSVSVAGLLGDVVGADIAGRTRLVLDDHRLADELRQLGRHQAREDVGGAARRIGYDDAHLFGETLRGGRPCTDEGAHAHERGRGEECEQRRTPRRHRATPRDQHFVETVAQISKLRHRGEQPLDVLRTRQAVIAVLDQREHDVVAGEARRQLDRVPPGHVGILHALQDAHGTAGLDHAAEQEMLAAVLDQAAGDQIGLLGIGRRPLPGRRSPRSAACTSGGNRFHISSSVKSTAGAISTSAGDRARPPARPPRQLARQQQREPAAHGRADQRPAGRGSRHRIPRRLSSSQRPMVPSVKVAAGLAVAGIVEADEGTAVRRAPSRRAPRPWCPACRT